MTILILALLGLCAGSFVNALIWRTHESNKAKKGKKLSVWSGRSMCPNCKHTLEAKDLVPVLSWIELRGKCRYCGKPIHWQYPAVELATATLFITSYLLWPYGFGALGWLQLGLWLVVVLLFVALIVYDLRWMLLPNQLVYTLISISLLIVITRMFTLPAAEVILGSLGGVLCSAGVFYALFQVSSGKWIGGGDVKLAIALGLLVGTALDAILMLFLASLSGSLLAIPLLVAGKAKRKTHLPFGPFLIMATYIVVLVGDKISLWYERTFLGL